MKRMYEARNKSEFLKTVNNAAWYEWLFNRIFDYEHKNSKDLFDFNKDELLDILKDLKFSFSTLNVNKSYISKYIEWAIVNNKKLNQKNAATEITTSDLKSIATKPKCTRGRKRRVVNA